MGGRCSIIIVTITYLCSFLLTYRGADKSLARPERKQATATEDFDFHISYLLSGGISVLFIYEYITILASNEIFSPTNKIHREVGRAKDLPAPLYLVTYLISFFLSFLLTYLLTYLISYLLIFLLTYFLTCLLTYLLTIIEFSLDGSSPYSSTDNTNKNKYT